MSDPERTLGRVLAIDPGTVRVGLAMSDPLRITAQPFDVVPAAEAIDRIVATVADHAVTEVVVGLPIGSQGNETESTAVARAIAEQLEAVLTVPVVLMDERYTSRMAESVMIDAGARRRTRRRNLDKVAAAVILRSYLDQTGRHQ